MTGGTPFIATTIYQLWIPRIHTQLGVEGPVSHLCVATACRKSPAWGWGDMFTRKNGRNAAIFQRKMEGTKVRRASPCICALVLINGRKMDETWRNTGKNWRRNWRTREVLFRTNGGKSFGKWRKLDKWRKHGGTREDMEETNTLNHPDLFLHDVSQWIGWRKHLTRENNDAAKRRCFLHISTQFKWEVISSSRASSLSSSSSSSPPDTFQRRSMHRNWLSPFWTFSCHP